MALMLAFGGLGGVRRKTTVLPPRLRVTMILLVPPWSSCTSSGPVPSSGILVSSQACSLALSITVSRSKLCVAMMSSAVQFGNEGCEQAENGLVNLLVPLVAPVFQPLAGALVGAVRSEE